MTTWGTIVGVISIVIFLVVFSAFSGMAKGKIDLRLGISIVSLGGVMIIIVGLITYMLSIILSMGA